MDDFRAAVASLTRDLVLVSVSGELDLYTAGQLQARIDEAGAVGADTVLVDLSEVSFVDSTALAALVQETKRLEGRGHSLVLVTNDPRTRRVVEERAQAWLSNPQGCRDIERFLAPWLR